MRYVHVSWKHDHPDEPVELYSELDDASWEIRTVEIFADGSAGYASLTESTEGTRLGEERFPPLEEIAVDPQFRPEEIGQSEFEKLWNKAKCPPQPGRPRLDRSSRR